MHSRPDQAVAHWSTVMMHRSHSVWTHHMNCRCTTHPWQGHHASPGARVRKCVSARAKVTPECQSRVSVSLIHIKSQCEHQVNWSWASFFCDDVILSFGLSFSWEHQHIEFLFLTFWVFWRLHMSKIYLFSIRHFKGLNVCRFALLGRFMTCMDLSELSWRQWKF